MSFSAIDSELTGPLFATPEMRAAFASRARLAAMLRVEEAVARAQSRYGDAPAALASAIAAIKPEQFDQGWLGAATARAGAPSIPVAKAIRKLLPVDLEPAYSGTASQDIEDTAGALQIKQAFACLAPDLIATLRGFLAMAKTHRQTPCVGRTFGQHATPITFGAKVGVWGASLADIAARFFETRARASLISLNGSAGTRSGMGARAEDIARAAAHELRLNLFPCSWHAIRSRQAETGFYLAELIGSLAKIATDIASLASAEAGEVAEPYTPGRGGALSMPHKRNPVSCMVILAAHASAPALASSLVTAMAGAHERSLGLWQSEWHALPQLFGLASGALREARNLAEGLIIDAARMRLNMESGRGLIYSEALTNALSPLLGAGAAYALVEQAVERVRAEGLHLREVGQDRDFISCEHTRAIWSQSFDLAPLTAAGAHAADQAADFIQTVVEGLETTKKNIEAAL